ncbi:zinc finger MYM-type protein 1-like [Acanthochromis polyacanthus]|uniref:zinc finger MYM-type protein 1-like n=1 Tax=Acanthochromis polyacanthus TaxID=80966 RepID=UPI002234E3F8|nr:zinc finger MYM-type protein 1-like [Acanthochromis polyacanthus]
MTCTKPAQPDPKFIVVQKRAKCVLTFHQKWFTTFPWLHYSATLQGVICFHCAKVYLNQSTFASKCDPAFVSVGFRNGKKAIQRFSEHAKCQLHIHAMNIFAQKGSTVASQLSSAVARQQEEARNGLSKIVGSIKYLARQGLALRDHVEEKGNLSQHLKEKAEDDPAFQKWLETHKQDYTSPLIQNEILGILSNDIVRGIADTIRCLPVTQFALIVDGTQDISGREQESVCLRFVDHDLYPHEEFIGMYSVTETTGECLAKVALDVLCRLNLPLSALRGQTYNGAANMSGKYSGTQVLIREKQPRALYAHCGAHCVNLVAQKACAASTVVQDALDWVHQLGVLCGQSGKFKQMFHQIAKSDHGTPSTLKPLCETRWTVRHDAIRSVLTQYDSVLTALEEMAGTDSPTAATANGLFQQFMRGSTVLGLVMAQAVIGELECLNSSLQRRTQTVSGMQAAVCKVQSTLNGKRSDEAFQSLFEEASTVVNSLDLEPITMPRVRQPPKRYSGESSGFGPKTPAEFYRVEFYKVLDTIHTQFTERFQQGGLSILQKLENTLLSGNVDPVIHNYPEINAQLLEIQVPMFKHNYTYNSCGEATSILKGLPCEVRGLFTEVETLVRLLLVVPVSSSEAERSFSALRRLKTWLRTTMTQQRLNHVAVCHIHQDKLDLLTKKSVCAQFVCFTP